MDKKKSRLAFSAALAVPAVALIGQAPVFGTTDDGPTPTTEEPASPIIVDESGVVRNPDFNYVAADAALEAGYNWGQMVTLAEAWNTDELSAKIIVGEALIANDTTKIAEINSLTDGVADPAPGNVHTDAEVDDWLETNGTAMSAYWDAGYNYGQLLALADEWNVDEFEAKIRAGEAILAGDTSAVDAIVTGVPDAEYVETD